MIVNLVGPPASGKSTFASRFTLENPTWIWYTIDMCRDDLLRTSVHAEDRAWETLKQLVSTHPRVILETGGLSWRLPVMLEELEGVKEHTDGNGIYWRSHEREVLNVMLTGPANVFHKRLMQRHEWFKPVHYNLQDEHNAVDYTLERMTKVYPHGAYLIRVDENTEDEIYEEISSKVLEFQRYCLEQRKEIHNESDQ